MLHIINIMKNIKDILNQLVQIKGFIIFILIQES